MLWDCEARSAEIGKDLAHEVSQSQRTSLAAQLQAVSVIFQQRTWVFSAYLLRIYVRLN